MDITITFRPIPETANREVCREFFTGCRTRPTLEMEWDDSTSGTRWFFYSCDKHVVSVIGRIRNVDETIKANRKR